LPRRQIAITRASVTSCAVNPRAHQPAHRTPREQIDDWCHVKPAFYFPDIGEVSDPFAIWSSGFKAAVEHFRSDGARLPLTQIGRQAASARTGFESL
jgi:hypothetical protein